MKIFKNKVGRPSNATIRNRRIISLSFLAAIVIIVSLLVVNKDKIFNLKGASSRVNIFVDYDCDTFNGSTDKCSKLRFNISSSEKVYYSYKLGNYKTYTISQKSPKTSFSFDVVSAFKKANLGVPSVTDGTITINVYSANGTKIDGKTVVLKQNGFIGKTYYYNQDDYSDVVFCGRSDGDSIAYAGCGLVSSAMALSALTQTQVLPETLNDYVNPSKNGGEDKYFCAGNSGIGGIPDLIRNYGKSKLNTNFEVKTVWSVSDALDLLNKNKGKSVAIFHSSDDAFTGAGHYYFIPGITGSGNNDHIYIYDPKSGDTREAYGTSKLRNGKWRIGDYRSIANVTLLYVITKTGTVQTAPKNITLSCPPSAKVGQKVYCYTNQSGVTITLGGANSLASGISSKFITTDSDMTKSVQYTNALFTNYKSQIKRDGNGKEYINAHVTAIKGLKHVKNYIKIYRTVTTTTTKRVVNNNTTIRPTEPNNERLKSFKFTCSTSGTYTNQEFKCTTDTYGVTITVGGANSLASGYKSSLKSGVFAKDKEIKIKYTDKLFTNYPKIINKDAKGNRYILARIYASKSGYKSIQRAVRIYQKSAVSQNNANSVTKKNLAFNCPDTVTVGEKIICTTNQAGVTIRTSNPEALASNYTEKFVTTNKDMTKALSYTKPGTYYVKASKSGYYEVTKAIKVAAKQSTPSANLVLTCPSSAYVGDPILCITNMVGVTIRTSHPQNLVAGYSEKFVTKSTDLSKSLKYKAAGTYYIKASKAGYGDVTKIIRVTQRTTQTAPNNNNNRVGKDVNIAIKSISTPSGLFANKNDKIFEIKLNSFGQKVKYYSYVLCNTKANCTNSGAWDIKGNAVAGKYAAKAGEIRKVTLRTNSNYVNNQTYYLRVATYDKYNANNIMHKAVFQIIVDKNANMSLILLTDTVWFK